MSHTADIFEWVRSLRPGVFFRLADLPAPNRGLASAAMHRMLAADAPIVQRLAPGFFLRQHDDGTELFWRDPLLTAYAHAWPGSGLAGYSAVNEMAWTTQIPVPTQVCVLGRRLTPIDACITYCTRHNPNRALLTWAEVSMLEAVIHFELAEIGWAEALRKVARDVCLSRLGEGAVIRSEPLREVAHTERGKPALFHERVEELCDLLPSERTWRDYIWERNPAKAIARGWTPPQEKESADV